MSSKLSQKDFAFKFIPYLPQDAGYKIETQLKSAIMPSSLTQLNDNDQVQRVELLEIMNDDLSNLLKMQFGDFIQNIIREDIQKYLCTFLHFSRRSTDNIFSINDKELNASNKGGEGKIDMFGIDELSQSIRRKTFLIIYRLTDSKQISTKFSDESKYGQLLYDQWIFDVPRLFDFCAIYYFSNPMITKQIISYIFKTQPKYNGDLKHSIDLMKQKIDEICDNYHSMDPDLKLSRNDGNPLNTLDNIYHDINLIKEILVNLFSLFKSYDYAAMICYEIDILTLMVILIDVTFPIIQEQLNQFIKNKKFKNDNVYNQYHPSIVISMRLCLSITDSILSIKYKPLYDDMNGYLDNDNDEKSNVESLQCKALKLCEFLNNTTNVGGFQKLHFGARPFIEVGGFSRKLFGTFVNIQKLINHLLSKRIISLSDIGMISHLIQNISKQIMNEYKNEFISKDEEKKDNDDNMDEQIVKLLQIFPDHSDSYCRKLLAYFNGKFDPAVNAVLEGTVPLSIEAIDDHDIDIINIDIDIDKDIKSKTKTKGKKKNKKQKGIDPKLQQYMEFTGRVLKKDDDEEFFDMFGFDGNKKSMKKYQKRITKNYNLYTDDVDDSYLQYQGYGVDDGEELSMSDDMEYIETERQKEEEKKKDDKILLNQQLNRHSYHFVPDNKPKKVAPKQQQPPPSKGRGKYDKNNKNNNRKQQQIKGNEYRANSQEYEQRQPQQHNNQQYRAKYDNRRDNRYRNQNDGYNDNGGYNDNYNDNRGYADNNRGYNRSRNNNYNDNYADNNSYYGVRGRGRGSGRGRGRGRGNPNKYRQQRKHATNQYRRNQAHKKYSRINQQ